ncbi:MAG TPA: transposase [Spirochaetota bacterium]|nr:transposase [Spirochaetota bacterium]
MGYPDRQFNFNTLFHIINRFNPELSLTKHQLAKIRTVLYKGVKKYNVKINYFVILKTHFHLSAYFAAENKITMSKFMQWLGTQMAKKINKLLNRSGTVFRRRFKSFIIKSRQYLETLLKYLKNNPQKHLGIKPENWPFSSYNFYFNASNDGITVHYATIFS